MDDSSKSDQKRSPLDYVLGLVTEVKPGEGVTALLLTLNIFLLLLAYYLIKPVREALILAMPSGAKYKSYMSGAIAIGLLAAVPAYSGFAKRVARNRLVISVTLFFASHLLVFYVASFFKSTQAWMGLVFYLWVGIFNMMVIAQAWAFAADIYTEEQGKRIFALIGVGASVGSAVGSFIGIALAKTLGVYPMLVVAAGILVLIAGLVQIVHRRELGRQQKAAVVDKPPPEKPTGEGAFEMVFRHRYLSLLAVFSVTFTLVNTNGEYMLGVLIKEFAEATEAAGNLPMGMSRGDYIGSLYSEFFLYVNIIGAGLQLFVVSRLVKFAGLDVAFLILPVVAFLDASLFALMPVLLVLRFGKIAENSIDYSVNNTVRNMLWLPTTKEMKYRAKQAVDTFFVRMGDVGSAVLVFVLAELAGHGVRVFAIVNAGVIGLWLIVARMILRERKRLLEERGDAAGEHG